MLNNIGAWLTDPAHWTGPNGIPQRILEHLIYSGISLLIAMLIAIPLGVVVGHSGRAKWAVSLANSLRAVRSRRTLSGEGAALQVVHLRKDIDRIGGDCGIPGDRPRESHLWLRRLAATAT